MNIVMKVRDSELFLAVEGWKYKYDISQFMSFRVNFMNN